MTDVTSILGKIEAGDADAVEQLFPLVYEHLRTIAAKHLSGERPGHALDATMLVHDAFLRLVDVQRARHWSSRAHFLSAASEAMRRILVDDARTRLRQKRGGRQPTVPLDGQRAVDPQSQRAEEIIAIGDLIDVLGRLDATAAGLIKLRYFGGLSLTEAAETLGISRSAAYEEWRFAKSWIARQMGAGPLDE